MSALAFVAIVLSVAGGVATYTLWRFRSTLSTEYVGRHRK